MTRHFNEQRREDVRPSSRRQPSGRYGEERSPRPARPRLNREAVDRGWESGARRDHADYHPRQNNGQPPHGNRRPNQYTASPSAQNSRRPYDNDRYQRSERTPNGNYNPHARDRRSYAEGPRPQSGPDHDNDRYQRSERTPNGNYNPRARDRRSYAEGPRPQSGPDHEQYHDQRPPYRDRNGGYERRSFDRDQRPPRTFERGKRPPRDVQQPKTQHPRWRSRPMAQNDDYPRGRHDFSRHERFEGDYEHFETPETPRQSRSYRDEAHQGGEERHVTRLPDGRVLKGPRPVQRKNAQFWTEVAHDTEALVEPINVPEKEVASMQDKEPTVSPPAHGRKFKEKTAKPRSTGPKPSRRGFKWPTP